MKNVKNIAALLMALSLVLAATSHSSAFAEEAEEKVVKISYDKMEGVALEFEGKAILGEFEVMFDPSNTKMWDNVRLSANSLNGIILKPGEVFSFIKAIGEITEKNGYRNASLLEDGTTEYADKYAVGIGIVYSATALYNASLQAHLKVLKRYDDSTERFLIKDGIKEATVTPERDLEIENDKEYSILIVINADKANNSGVGWCIIKLVQLE